MPSAAEITVEETLQLLDGPLSALATGVSHDQYAFWLGSGISLGRMEGLRQLIPRVLDFLQRQVAAGDPTCRFRAALNAIMRLANLSPAEQAATNLESVANSWPTLNTIVDRLIGNYARFLDQEVDGEPPDYLLWDAVNVPATYANPAIQPDIEHLCLAVLILEGVSSEIPSANWDGLVERAVERVAPATPAVVVCVEPDDLRKPARQAKLYKFHGCAILAGQDEARYRPRLIGRQSQINGWKTRAENVPMVQHLIGLATTKRTLMLGLSVQDVNIQAIFAEAEARMAWPWPSDPPAYVFSENEIGVDQKILLQNVYRAEFTPANRAAIQASALVRAYAKPLLAALVLHVVFSKLAMLVDIAPGPLSPPDRANLVAGQKAIRTKIAAAANPNTADSISLAVRHYSRFMALFHEGDATPATLPYRPITTRPIQHLAADPTVPTAGMRELAVALGLIGSGVQNGDWSISLVDLSNPKSGAFQITSGPRTTKAYVVSNATAATRLGLRGHLEDGDDAIVIYGSDIAPVMPRSPSPRRSRTGVPGTREVSISALLADAPDTAGLMQRFREELSI